MSVHTLWYVITPLYHPATGGAAMYSKVLAEALADDGADVVIVTEAFPNTERRVKTRQSNGSIVLDRLFPLRAGRAAFDWRSYAAYARANMLMLGLPNHLGRAIRETGARRVIVLIHSSFFENPSLMPLILRRMRRQLPDAARLIVDVRDLRFKDSMGRAFAHFDAAICCSSTISDRVRGLVPPDVEVVHIPIPFTKEAPPDDDEVDRVLAEYGLAGIPFVLNPNGIRDGKRYPEMLEAVRELRRTVGYENTALVTIGPARNWKARDDAAIAEGLLIYLGAVPHRSALALMKAAKATMILSLVEGVPRSALESLALETPVVVPPIAEFLKTIPTSVARCGDPGDIARLIVRVCEQTSAERYPLEAHSMGAFVTAYRALEPNVPPEPGRL